MYEGKMAPASHCILRVMLMNQWLILTQMPKPRTVSEESGRSSERDPRIGAIIKVYRCQGLMPIDR